MLKDLVETLVAQGKALAPAVIPAPPGERNGVYFLRRPDGSLERHHTPRPTNAEACDVATLIAYAGTSLRLEDKPPELWYWKDAMLLCSGGNREDRLALPLRHSAQLLQLGGFGAAKAFTQKELVHFLRHQMGECGGREYLDLVRAVKFRVLQEGQSEIRQGKASIGRSLEAQLDGSDRMPDQVTFKIPAFLNVLQQKRYPARFTLDVDAEAESFRLSPLPNEYDRVLAEAMEDLGAYLDTLVDEADVAIRVYHGNPKLEAA